MPTFSPVFCRQTVTGANLTTLTQGARSATLAAGPVGMVVGEHLFVARTDYTEAEYLGKITAIVGTTISFQISARSTRNTASYSYQVFTPYTAWQATDVPGTGGTNPIRESGIETLETTGKQLLHTRVKEQRDYVELLFKDVLAADWQAYKDWIDSELEGGLYQFVCAYMDHEAGRTRCDIVKLRAPGAPMRATENVKVLRSWPCELQIVQRDYFLP